MNESTSNHSNDPKFWKTIKDDWKETPVKRTLKQDFRELRDFYISSEQKKRMDNMGKIKRWFFILFWLLKGMFFKLTPIRRILVLISVILVLAVTTNVNAKDNKGNTNPLPGFLVLTFVLMLELKDKLLARSELKEGRAVQISLLPDESPEIPGWDIWLYSKPANDVGGDFVDFMKINKDRCSLSLGDVAGKGLGAALLMAKLQATLRAIAPDLKSLAEIGNKINSIFYRDSLRNKFASLVYVECHENSGMLQFVNAGHFPPILIKGNNIEETAKGAPALGMMKDTKYTEEKVKLEGGNIFFIYSDGLTEANNENAEFFGEDRLYDLLKKYGDKSSKEMGKSILNSVDIFRGDAISYDDLSMIIIKRTI